MNPARSPIFCVDSVKVFNRPKDEKGIFSIPLFHVKLMTKEQTYWVHANLWSLLDYCKEHAPAEYRYVEQLQWYVANGGKVNFQLLQAMEDEGFEVERLMTVYFEREGWEEFTLPPGMDEESLRAEAITDGDDFEDMHDALVSFLMSEPIETMSSVAIAQAFQVEVWRTYPALEELHQRELAGFITYVSSMAQLYVTSEAASFEYHLENGELKFEAEREFSPEGIRRRILKDRRSLKRKPDNTQHVQVEVVEIVHMWLDSPLNKVTIWYKGSCGGEEFYNFLNFSDLVDEAALKFPEIYGRIEELREQLTAVRPKEREIVEALKMEGIDWLPVLESYVNDWVDISENLTFDRKIKKAGRYNNHYEIHAKNKGRNYDEESLKEAHKYAYLKDHLKDIGYQVLSDHFPGLKMRAKPWMLKSLDQCIQLVVGEAMDLVSQLMAKTTQVGDGCE